MKRKVLLMAAVLICGLMFSTCNMLKGIVKDAVKKPEVTLKSVDFSNIDFNGLTLLSKVSVKNDNVIDIPLPKIDWDLLVVNNPFLNGVIQSNGSLKSMGSTEVQFPVTFTYANLVKGIAALNDNNARYKIKMTAHIPIPGLGDLSWPFEHEGKIPIVRVPNISVATAPAVSLTKNSMGIPTGGKIEFALNVKNNSNIAVKLSELFCVLKIGNTSLSKAGITGNPNINSGATEKLTFQLSLSASDITAIGATVLSGSNFNYSLTGNYKLGIPEFPLLNEVGNTFSLQKK